MGCDIHMYIEKYSTEDYYGPKDKREERGKKLETILDDNTYEPRWIPADKWDIDFDNEWTVHYHDRIFSGRNYSLFSILADVRNHSDGINPISEPRGVPDDASFAYKQVVKAWGSDGHSHTYFTLQELLDVDWSQWSDDHGTIGFQQALENVKSIDDDYSKVRLVFFFDN